MLITLLTPNVEELLVSLRELLQKPRVGIDGRTLKVTERVVKGCGGGDIVDCGTVEGRRGYVCGARDPQRTPRERPKNVVVAPPCFGMHGFLRSVEFPTI
jgi:hypothetical protein